MEINITAFTKQFEPGCLMDFSASRAERGQNAAKETWENALNQAAARPMLRSRKQIEALRAWATSSGGWDADEIAAWTRKECNALFIQMISGDLREAHSLCPGDGPAGIDWVKAEKLAERGTIAGCVHLSGKHVFYYLGG